MIDYLRVRRLARRLGVATRSSDKASALRELSRIRTDAAVAVIVRALGDRDPVVQRAAIDALGSSSTQGAAQALIEYLIDGFSKEREHAFDVIRHLPIDSVGAVTALSSGYRQKSAIHEFSRRLPVSYLLRLMAMSALFEPVWSELLQRDRNEPGFFKTFAHSAECGELLVRVYSVASERDRESVVRLATFIPGPAGAVVCRLALSDSRPLPPEAHAQAVTALGCWGSSEDETLLARLLNNQSEYVRSCAVTALARVSSDSTALLTRFIAQFHSENSDLVKCALLEAICNCDDDRVSDALAAALMSRSASLQKEAARALQTSRSARAREILLAGIGSNPSNARYVIPALLNSPDDDIVDRVCDVFKALAAEDQHVVVGSLRGPGHPGAASCVAEYDRVAQAKQQALDASLRARGRKLVRCIGCGSTVEAAMTDTDYYKCGFCRDTFSNSN